MTDSPSATIVPLPTFTRYGVSCCTAVPKLDPVWSTRERSYPRALRQGTMYELSPHSQVKNPRLVRRAIARCTE